MHAGAHAGAGLPDAVRRHAGEPGEVEAVRAGRLQLHAAVLARVVRRPRDALVRRAVRRPAHLPRRMDDARGRQLRRARRRLAGSGRRPVRGGQPGLRGADRRDRRRRLDDRRDLQLPGRERGGPRRGAEPAGGVEHVRDHGRLAEGLRAPQRRADQRVHLDRPGPRPDEGADRPPEPRHRRRGLLPRRPGQDGRRARSRHADGPGLRRPHQRQRAARRAVLRHGIGPGRRRAVVQVGVRRRGERARERAEPTRTRRPAPTRRRSR